MSGSKPFETKTGSVSFSLEARTHRIPPSPSTRPCSLHLGPRNDRHRLANRRLKRMPPDLGHTSKLLGGQLVAAAGERGRGRAMWEGRVGGVGVLGRGGHWCRT